MSKVLSDFILYKNYKKRMLFSFVISLLLSVFLVLGQDLERFGTLKFDLYNIIYFLIYIIINFIVVYSSYYIFERTFLNTSKHTIKKPLVFIISFALIFSFDFIILLGLCPGIFAFDTADQFLTYELKMITEHHPVIHTLFFGYIINGYSYFNDYNMGGFAYSVIQLFFMAIGFSFVTYYIYSKTQNIIVWIISILFYAFYPPMTLQSLSATKDSLFLAFMVITIVLSLVLIDSAKTFFDDKCIVFIMVVSTFFMIVLRNNCIYAAPFLLIGLFLFVNKKYKKNTIIILSIVIGLFFIYKFAVVPAVVYEKEDGREKMSVPIQQMNRIYNDSNSNISLDESNMIYKLLGDGVNYYNPRISDYSKAYFNMDYYNEHKVEVIKMYFSIISKNPKISFESFAENTLGFWYPYATLTFYADGEKAYWPVECWEFWSFDPKLPYVLNFYKIFENSDFILYNPLAKIFLYPGSVFFLFVIMFGYSLYKGMKNYNIIFLYILMLLGTYLLGPVVLVRYSIYLYGIIPLYFVLINNRKNVSKSGRLEVDTNEE